MPWSHKHVYLRRKHENKLFHHILFSEVLGDVSDPVSSFISDLVWRDGAHTVLKMQLCQVQYATLTSASCPVVKSLLTQGCSLFLVLARRLSLSPWALDGSYHWL